jgi:hypothetical protein
MNVWTIRKQKVNKKKVITMDRERERKVAIEPTAVNRMRSGCREER